MILNSLHLPKYFTRTTFTETEREREREREGEREKVLSLHPKAVLVSDIVLFSHSMCQDDINLG